MGSKNSKIKSSDDDLRAKQRLRKPDGLSISDLQGQLKGPSKCEVNGKYETDVESLPKYVKESGSSLAMPNEPPPAFPAEIALTPKDVAFLRDYEVYLLLDDSASMTLGDPSETLWQQVHESTILITDYLRQIGVHFRLLRINDLDVDMDDPLQSITGSRDLSREMVLKWLKNAQPSRMSKNSTPTERQVDRIVQHLNKATAGYKCSIVVLTDGKSDDDPQELVNHLQRLHVNPRNLGIQYLQFGNDPSARRILRDVDDHFTGTWDIVDTVALTGPGDLRNPAFLRKVLLGAINKEMDHNHKADLYHPAGGGSEINVENTFKQLAAYDVVFLLDDSTSMRKCPSGREFPTRWQEAIDAFVWLATNAAKYDKDGIDLHLLNGERPEHSDNCKQRHIGTVAASLRTMSLIPSTPIGRRVKDITDAYMQKLTTSRRKTKPLLLLIITDGRPTDEEKLTQNIISLARTLDRRRETASQVGIQFIQVGDSSTAREYLEGLDDGLTEAARALGLANGSVRDIVDTVPYRGDQNLQKALLGAINRKIDKEKVQEEVRRWPYH